MIKANPINVGIAIAFMAMVFFSITKVRSCNHNREVLNDIKENIVVDTAKHWYDKDSIEHATNKEIIINRDAANILYKRKLDSISRLLGIKNRQIKDLQETVISIKGHIVAPIDTISFQGVQENGVVIETKALTFEYADSFIKVNGVIDTVAHLDYSIEDIPIIYTGYFKRKWFLGKKHCYVDAYSESKNVHIKKLTKISIEKK